MSKTYVTLNIGASVRLLAVRGGEVVRWGSMPLAPGLVRDGLITQPKVVGTVINALFESAGVSKERVITTLTGLPFTYRVLRLPRLKPAAQQEAVQRAAQKEMQLPLEEMQLSWQVINGGDEEQDFFVLGVPRKIMDAMAQTLEEAGIKPYIMDVKPLALARAARRSDAIIADLETECFDIILLVGGSLAVMHTVIPRGKGSVIGDNIVRITDELVKTVEFYNAGHPDHVLSPTTPLLLTGELAADTRTRQLIQNATEYPVEHLLPPFKLPPDLPDDLFTANIGLALKKTSLKTVAGEDASFPHDINVNLMLGEYGVKARRVRTASIVLAAVCLIGAGLFYPAYHFRSQAVAETVRLQAELTGAQQELNQRLSANNEAQQAENNINEILARVAGLKEEQRGVLDRGGEFTGGLTLVTGALPDGARFTALKISGAQIIMEGEADNSFTVIDYVTALEKTGKFSDVRIGAINEGGTAGTPGVTFSIIMGK